MPLDWLVGKCIMHDHTMPFISRTLLKLTNLSSQSYIYFSSHSLNVMAQDIPKPMTKLSPLALSLQKKHPVFRYCYTDTHCCYKGWCGKQPLDKDFWAQPPTDWGCFFPLFFSFYIFASQVTQSIQLIFITCASTTRSHAVPCCTLECSWCPFRCPFMFMCHVRVKSKEKSQCCPNLHFIAKLGFLSFGRKVKVYVHCRPNVTPDFVNTLENTLCK